MAILVLMTSTGFGLVEHHCMMRGKSLQLMAIETNGACKSCVKKNVAHVGTHKTVVKKADCCKEEQKYQKVDFVSSFSQLLAKILKSCAEAVGFAVKAIIFSIADFLLPTSSGSSVVHSFSSLFHGRSMLSFVQSFLI
jgi:hypothetical protein